jgi:hypothetical protein
MKSSYKFEGNIALRLNDLHREQMKRKILADILIDMEVCRLEGWDIMQYPTELRELMNDIIERKIS